MRSLPTLTQIALLGVFAAISGCGGKSQGLEGSAGSSGTPGGDMVVPCPADVPTPEELAQTPRELQDLELLALKFSDGVVADQSIYDRIVSDVHAAQEFPDVRGIYFRSQNDGQRVILSVDEPTYNAMQTGDYRAWACLNDAYGGASTEYLGSPVVFVDFPGLLNMARIATHYVTLPGIRQAIPGDGLIKDGPTICATRDGETWHYVFDQASDCTRQCMTHVYFHFSSSAPGVVTYLGAPAPDELRTLAPPEACH